MSTARDLKRYAEELYCLVSTLQDIRTWTKSAECSEAVATLVTRAEEAFPALLWESLNLKAHQFGVNAEFALKFCKNDKWNLELWQGILEQFLSLQKECHDLVAAGKTFPYTSEQKIRCGFDSAVKYLRKLGDELPPETAPCYVCLPPHTDRMPKRVGCCMPIPRTCPLCEKYGDKDFYYRQIPKRLYFETVEIDGKEYKGPGVDCTRCMDTNFAYSFVYLKHPKFSKASDGMNGLEPIVCMACERCFPDKKREQMKKVEEHFEKFLPAHYPEKMVFDSVEAALFWAPQVSPGQHTEFSF